MEDKNRFTGYEPPLVSLDETTNAYWLGSVNRDLYNQPDYYSTRASYMASDSINVKNIPVNPYYYPDMFTPKLVNCKENNPNTNKLYPLI